MKKLLIIPLLILLTGCTANINITLNDSTVEHIMELTEEAKTVENLDIDMNHIEDNETLKKFAHDLALFENNSGIERVFIDESDVYGYRYTQTLPYQKLESNSLIMDCYDDVEVDKGDTLTINTSKEFKCFDEYETLDEVNLTISSNYELIDTNADIIGGNEYTWNINKNDTNKPIYLSLKVKNTNKNYIIISTIFIILTIIGAFIYLQKKNKRKYQ